MKTHFNIIIAGAGGIAKAAGLILAEWSTITPTIYIGNRTLAKAQKVAKWIENGTTKFPETPEIMVARVNELINCGANIIGGCCGTTPAHIKAISEKVKKINE